MTIKQILLMAILLAISPLISFATDYYIATKSLNVRTGAGTDYTVSFTLQKGDEVEVLSKDGSWYKVNYLGNIGYAHSKYLKSISDSETNTSQQSVKDNSTFVILITLGVIGFIWLFNRWMFEMERKSRRDYYNDEYLTSDAWKRKRHVVLKRDNWRCVYCGGHATQVHHKRYAKYNIGREPIDWLVSVCKSCHDSQQH